MLPRPAALLLARAPVRQGKDSETLSWEALMTACRGEDQGTALPTSSSSPPPSLSMGVLTQMHGPGFKSQPLKSLHLFELVRPCGSVVKIKTIMFAIALAGT